MVLATSCLTRGEFNNALLGTRIRTPNLPNLINIQEIDSFNALQT